MKACAVNSIRMVQTRKLRSPIFDRSLRPVTHAEIPELAHCRGVFSVQRRQWHSLGVWATVFCTEGAQEMQKVDAAKLCDLCFAFRVEAIASDSVTSTAAIGVLGAAKKADVAIRKSS